MLLRNGIQIRIDLFRRLCDQQAIEGEMMIRRIKLPHEDEFLDGTDADRSALYRTKDVETAKCECQWCALGLYSAIMFGVFHLVGP
jgi:hypothetical protein